MIAYGTVSGIERGLIRARLPRAAVGASVYLGGNAPRRGSILEMHDGGALIACEGSLEGIGPGTNVRCALDKTLAPVVSLLLPPAPLPSQRVPLTQPMWTGVRAIDGLLPFARGARIGVFGPPGCGKSSLLHSIARHARTDVAVIALIGERGREAEEWQHVLPRHANLICATSDRAPAERIAAAHTAMAQADALCRAGLHVLFVMDSLARYGNALREQAVAAGEPVGRAGFPASVFAQLARFVEIAGARADGSITLVCTVLSDGDERDPLSDASRALLDGHLQLSQRLANAGHFPAIDVPASASRTAHTICSQPHLEDAATVRAAIVQLERSHDARSLGLVSSEATRAVAAEQAIEAFLRQGKETSPPARTLSALSAVADTLRG